MTPMCSFIIGHPTDTEETIQRTFELSRRLRDQYGAAVATGCLVPYPGTGVRRRAAELGLQIESPSWNDYSINNVVISTRNVSYERLRELMFEAGASAAGGRPPVPLD